jgi:hypothetical protein
MCGVLSRLATIPLDTHDIAVYFNSSRWIIEGGRLYRDVPSEYPLLANIIFAAWRYAANLICPGFDGFKYTWSLSAGLIYIYAVRKIVSDATPLVVLAWVAPAPIYFAVSRFDIYPTVATLLSLFAIRRGNYNQAAVWLGVAAAFKGYALFMLPAFCVFVSYQRGVVAAVYASVLVVAPMILSVLVTHTFVDWEAALVPFKIQAGRGLNGESTYDAINYLLGTQLRSEQISLLPQFLQLASALAAAAMRPKKFEDLVNSFIFAVLGFATFSAFYSPQFVLWFLPLVSFSGSRVMVISMIVLSWLTFLYFPISYGHLPALLPTTIVAVSLLRLFMMLLSIAHWLGVSAPASDEYNSSR